MSLINQMLKDLEKRRSRDLETSDTLSDNITWETRPDKKKLDLRTLLLVIILSVLLAMVAYLFWERTTYEKQFASFANNKTNNLKTIAAKKSPTSKKVEILTTVKTKKDKQEKRDKKKKKKKEKKIIENKASAAATERKGAVNVEEVESIKPLIVEKTLRSLNKQQLAEISYNKGYMLLQQGSLSQGKERLREALSLDVSHIKAREMLAGIYIKSAHYVEAAELLQEGVKRAPEYSLFAKLYARVLLEQKNPKLAIQILEQGASASDIEPDYHALLAATYQRVKNHQKAIDIYLQLVRIRPSAGVWWLGLAISLEKTDKNKEALGAYKRAQQSGSLNAGLSEFTNNRVAALKEIGFPEN